MSIQAEILQEVMPQPAEGSLPATPRPLITIRPPRGWQLVNVRELWAFRELIYFLTWRDVKVRYKQTLLGAAWAILQPLMLMAVFTIFLGRMAKVPAGDLPYPVFVYLGVLPWTFFATAISNGGNSVVNSERLITKVYFPRLAIPLASVGAAIVDFLLAFILLVILMIRYGIRPGPGLLLVPVVFLLITLTAAGVGMILAALNVAYRDFRYVIPFLIQVWMFATPTVYMQPGAAVSGPMRALLAINPMSELIAAFRSACRSEPQHWGQLVVVAAFAVVIFTGGCFYFRRMERSFADII